MNISITPPAVMFLRYQHIVTSPFIEFSNSTETVEIQRSLIQKFKDAGVNAFIDNRSIFVMSLSPTQQLCIGFYDSRMMVGFTYETL